MISQNNIDNRKHFDVFLLFMDIVTLIVHVLDF